MLAMIDHPATRPRRHAKPPLPASGSRIEARLRPTQRAAFRQLAEDTPGIDHEAYDAFWAQGDARYRRTLRIDDYRAADEASTHAITLAPLPHPSPANAVWFARFPALMDERLRVLSNS